MKYAALAATLALAAGCASSTGGTPRKVGPPGSAGTTSPSTAPSTAPTAAQNAAATRAETHRLLGLAPIPDGAKPTGDHDGLDGPALGSTQSRSTVDAVAFWQVDQPMAEVWQWVRQRKPAGLTTSGTGSGSGPSGTTNEGIAWSEPDRAYAVDLALEISLTPDDNGAGTTIRADGVGSWLDPTPIRDDHSGRRLRVTVTGGCPRTHPYTFDVSNSGADLDQALLPTAKPTAALVCFYFGANGKPPFALAGHRRLDPEGAQALADRFSNLRIAHTDGDGAVACPFEDGTVDLIAFSYDNRADVDLLNPVGGCPSVSNGLILVRGSITFQHPPNALAIETH